MLRIVAGAANAALMGADAAQASVAPRLMPGTAIPDLTTKTPQENPVGATEPLAETDLATMAAEPAASSVLPPIASLELIEQPPSVAKAGPADHLCRIRVSMKPWPKGSPRPASAISAPSLPGAMADLSAISQHLDVPVRRINREGWIEQAAVLATGRDTIFSRRLAQSQTVKRVTAATSIRSSTQ